MNWERLGLALQGAGAGIQGQGPQFSAMLGQRKLQQQQQQQELSEERRRAWALDNRNILSHLRSGHVNRAATLANNRLAELAQLPDADPTTTEYVSALIESGDIDEAIKFLEPLDAEAVNYGYLEPMAQPEEYTLAPGAERRRGEEVIARNETEAPETELERRRLALQLRELEDKITAREEDRRREAQQRESARESQIANIDSVMMEVDAAINEATDWATGISGRVTGLSPGSAAYNLNRRIETIKANLGFDKLQAMRDASPTGGALGQVSERELNFLQSTVANLDPGMGEERLKEALNKVQEHYQNWKMTLEGVNPDSEKADKDRMPSRRGGQMSRQNEDPDVVDWSEL